MPAYLAAAASSRHEGERIKGSRFIANVRPIVSEGDVVGIIEEISRDLPAASHHCYAWRLGWGPPRERSTDDGEPGGTAGPPILQALRGREISDTLVVVTRYYGGTNLGKGGLVRAYGGAAGGRPRPGTAPSHRTAHRPPGSASLRVGGQRHGGAGERRGRDRGCHLRS